MKTFDLTKEVEICFDEHVLDEITFEQALEILERDIEDAEEYKETFYLDMDGEDDYLEQWIIEELTVESLLNEDEIMNNYRNIKTKK